MMMMTDDDDGSTGFKVRVVSVDDDSSSHTFST